MYVWCMYVCMYICMYVCMHNIDGECMPEFIETVDDSGDDELIPLLTARGAPQLGKMVQPNIRC